MLTRSSFHLRKIFLSAMALQALFLPLSAYALGDGDDLRDVSEQRRTEIVSRPTTTAPAPAAPVSSTRFSPITPELAVPIPGVTFTPPIDDGDDIVVPFLAQYISGIYRYLLGICTLVAIIVVIVGGFQYLLGQTTGSAQTGLTMIKDAVAGLIVLYASYLILWTVNPKLVNLQPIRLARIQSVGIGETSGLDGDFSSVPPIEGGGSGVRCQLTYNQGQSPWNSIPYAASGQLIAGTSDSRPVCENSAQSNQFDRNRRAICLGTFQMSGCGPTAVASVLAYYGLQVSVSKRVPSPGTQAHLVDPIDVGILAILKGWREVGRGTEGKVSRSINQGFSQFQTRTITKTDSQAILSSLRAGRPLVIACANSARKAQNLGVHLYSDDAATVPIVSRRTGSPELYSDGHYMVLSGVVNDQILRIHDVGNGRSKTIRLADYQQQCGDAVEITPRPGAPETATETWGDGANATVVQTRLPAQNGNQCRATGGAAPGSQAQSTGEVMTYPFTYRPAGQTAVNWPDNTARLMFPTRLRSATSPARVRVFIYLHGNNDGNRTPEDRYLPYLRNALQRVSGSKDIVVMTPHHNNAGNDYPGFTLNNFYETGLRALQSVLPGVTVQDVVVGGHSGATCNGGPVLLQALNSPLPGTRGVIAYDGCMGDVMTPTNTTGGSGISLYLNPDNAGMGNENPRSVEGNETRSAIIRRLWGLGSQTCPACAASAGAQCYGQSATFPRPGGGELISFETNAGHGPSVETMTNIAFCAFYR